MRILYIERPKFGYLYNENAVKSTKMIPKAGWKIPSSVDWQSLITYVGGAYTAGNKLKEAGTTHWATTTPLVTNEYGLSLVAGGDRDSKTGIYNAPLPGYKGSYFTSTLHDGTTLLEFYQFTSSSSYSAKAYDFVNLTGAGLSIRLIAESTSLSNGQKGEYIGNDGIIYPTICINGVEWMSLNLRETLFRDLTPIPTKVSNSDWIADTTGAKCPCFNDMTYV